MHHYIGPPLPRDGRPPVFSQIYFCDRDTQMQHRQEGSLDPQVIATIQDVLHSDNPYVLTYRQAYLLAANNEFTIVFRKRPTATFHPRRNNMPEVDSLLPR
jgi:hypothetical protein